MGKIEFEKKTLKDKNSFLCRIMYFLPGVGASGVLRFNTCRKRRILGHGVQNSWLLWTSLLNDPKLPPKVENAAVNWLFWGKKRIQWFQEGLFDVFSWKFNRKLIKFCQIFKLSSNSMWLISKSLHPLHFLC